MTISKTTIDRVLDKPQRHTFSKFSIFKSSYYLTGGTALALQLVHRKSFDFDLFSATKIPPTMREQVIAHFGDNIRFSMDSEDQLTWFDENGVKVTIAFTPYVTLHPKVKTSSIDLSSVNDIASDKAFTIGRRGQYRDYVDLYFILKHGKHLKTIISEAKHRYKALFDEKLFLEQIVYFEDLEDTPIAFIRKPATRDELQSHLESQVKQYVSGR